MNTDPDAEPPKGATPAESLTKVLGQSEHVKDLVDECVAELSSVNAALRQELVEPYPLPGVADALGKNEVVEGKAQEASDELSIVNRGLEDEIAKRELAAPRAEEGPARPGAFDDPLTGLPNRALFHDRLEHGLAQARRHGRQLAVMFLDLDGFKRINDSYGHDLGDSVLRTIAGRLKDTTRGEDTMSRYGGDEFLCLLMEVRHEEGIVSIADKIINAIQAPCDVSVDDRTISLQINVSVGISIFPKNGSTSRALITSADKAMYQAKREKAKYSFAR